MNALVMCLVPDFCDLASTMPDEPIHVRADDLDKILTCGHLVDRPFTSREYERIRGQLPGRVFIIDGL